MPFGSAQPFVTEGLAELVGPLAWRLPKLVVPRILLRVSLSLKHLDGQGSEEQQSIGNKTDRQGDQSAAQGGSRWLVADGDRQAIEDADDGEQRQNNSQAVKQGL